MTKENKPGAEQEGCAFVSILIAKILTIIFVAGLLAGNLCSPSHPPETDNGLLNIFSCYLQLRVSPWFTHGSLLIPGWTGNHKQVVKSCYKN